MSKTYRVMGVQLEQRNNLQEQACRIARWIARAGEARADFVVFPEMILTGYHNHFSQEEAEAGYQVVSEACRKAGVCACVGAGEWREEGCFNQVRVWDDQGDYLGAHEKILVTDGEALQFRPGATLRVFQHKGLTFGCLICNDFWCNPSGTTLFDLKLVYQLARLGAKVIFHSVASFTDQLWKEFHEGNLRARAATAGVYVATANQAYGDAPVNCRSGLVSPGSEWIAEAPLAGEGSYLTEFEV